MAGHRKRSMTKGTTRKSPRTTALAATKAPGRRKKTRAVGKRRTARDTGTIGQAATKVVKSGARLVHHASQRAIAAGTKAAIEKLEGAMQSAADVTSTALQSVTKRVRKITHT
jgi:hypothetical protein